MTLKRIFQHPAGNTFLKTFTFQPITHNPFFVIGRFDPSLKEWKMEK
jgi:hypothetical protein